MIYKSVLGVPNFGFSGPLNQLDALRRQMDQLSKAFDADAYQNLPAGVFPQINLTEDRENYYVSAELPGVAPDELDIKADGKSISISGERKIQSENEGVKYHRKEREAGKFSRMIGLPGEIDPERINASLKNGILKIVLPKPEALKPRQISVN